VSSDSRPAAASSGALFHTLDACVLSLRNQTVAYAPPPRFALTISNRYETVKVYTSTRLLSLIR
jgi:hypothetical protein